MLAADANLSDEAYQDYILEGVSRTFALTIPQLPSPLAKVVGNAYLLCRIADTIEDEPTIEPSQKHYFARQFIEVVAGRTDAEKFANDFIPFLSERTPAAEHNLIKNTARVIRVTHSFSPRQRAAMERCVAIMAEGMAEFQINKVGLNGLKDLPHLDRYCYFVAGVVGEMLTDLFCDYCPEIELKKKRMLELAVSFGQGLQMTNILKDIWEDRARGACWLPQKLYQDYDFDLKNLTNENIDHRFMQGLTDLIAVAHFHLRNALIYTLAIPKREVGIRKFCLWALGMALLTLRKINAHRDFTSGKEVKISRRSVKATVFTTRLLVANDALLRVLFKLFSIGLPQEQPWRLFPPANNENSGAPCLFPSPALRAPSPLGRGESGEVARRDCHNNELH